VIDEACGWRFLANSAACVLFVARIVARIGELLPNLTSTGQNLAPGAVVRVIPSPADSRRSSAVISMVVMAVVLKLAAIHRTSCAGKQLAMAAGCDDRRCGQVPARNIGRWCTWWGSLLGLQPLHLHFTLNRQHRPNDSRQAQRQRHYGSATGMFLGSNRGPSSLRTVKRQRHHTPSIKGSSMAAPRC
jgi:hypothetical protein